ncbi:MAG: UDP-3-O-(3-hydroxymyristoyl)glucosamine N-acyltransferase [Zetaproteobacteria bacterium CG_4_9_14_3_um_filter_49_83]|nr:MAG: UDP-3-O-(3-hydroxymyristoyl)glucosamine N-acyltransferase [Zetaproteobacteria bacterium CG1_02_49_23]PIQ34186.1 MAG: UDP-3-O-(3-hydroxymyristoyl)glucosamine N-acyltransferase [Zetaproteobacteria bacterium CG17_big_fil_post_rev_8_21_14_2_50_50_13]PIV31237.1 MAG: UDP-3-O-(3-hydroxymyristoyl)glucosamine N-acyltransferase [Zetaproteobacteria bacterium CG02_land_8_20_14_3_00_50_9]PIY56961.1 MAG: UDP-3-O-(3-hydroxymyristoyl)glucosamine N-acyltransferase [Zetaproteobacteria bacterium CG_4_10_14
MITLTLEQVLDIVQGFVHETQRNIGCEGELKGINTLMAASADEISFLANVKYKHALDASKAGWILVSPQVYESGLGEQKNWIKVQDPYLAFAQLQRVFHPQHIGKGRHHASAVIAESSMLAANVDIAARVVIAEGVVIGNGTVIHAGVIIGQNVSIGEQCLIHPNVVIADGTILKNRVILQAGAVIGSDGFGYAWTGREHLKIPQTGRVILEDDVEIGANTCVDRGALGDTVIGQGVKLDNLIQVGHNVEIGALCIMASQTGISGSSKFGMGCQVGGQVGVAGHVSIGNGVKIAAKTGVISDLDAGGTYAGIPAMPHKTWLKVSALILRLPEVWKKLRTR